MRVFAIYAAKMTERREQRIRAALKQCDVRLGGWATGRVGNDEFPVHFTDVEWLSNDGDTDTELRIYVGDDMERATRLASELRACGMVAAIQCDDGD